MRIRGRIVGVEAIPGTVTILTPEPLDELLGSLSSGPLDATIIAADAEFAERRSPPPKTKKQEMVSHEHNVDEAGKRFVLAAAAEVFSWSPGRAGDGVPSTQVHVCLDLGPMVVTLRLKSPRALDELVGALLAHRQDVWGDGRGGSS